MSQADASESKKLRVDTFAETPLTTQGARDQGFS